MNFPIILGYLSSLITILIGAIWLRKLNRLPVSDALVKENSEWVMEGFSAFFKRVLSTLFQLILYLSIILIAFSFLFNKSIPYTEILGFVAGSTLIALASLFTLIISPRLVPRIIQASRTYFKDSIQPLFGVCTAIGCILFGFMNLGFLVCYMIGGFNVVTGYGLGIILASFFLRIGGGIFKVASGIGHDILPNIGNTVPNWDTRNPGTLLNLVGNYIGNAIGFNSDILGSYILVLLSVLLFLPNETSGLLTVWIITLSSFATWIGILFSAYNIRKKRTHNLLLDSIYCGALISGISFFFLVTYQLPQLPEGSVGAYFIGLLGAIAIGFTSERLVSYKNKSVKFIAKHAEMGGIMPMILAQSLGLRKIGSFTTLFLIVVLSAILVAGLEGMAMAALGMMTSTALVLIGNLFTPISSLTAKMSQITNSHPTILKNTKHLKSIGDTTDPIGSGFVVWASILATLSFVTGLMLMWFPDMIEFSFLHPFFLVGLVIGSTLPFVISGFLLKGSFKNILSTVAAILTQVENTPYLKENKGRPDIRRLSDECSRIAMDSLIIPGFLLAGIPLGVGYIFGPVMLAGIIIGAFLVGLNQSINWNITGNLLKNTKRYIESGHYGGKKSLSDQNLSETRNIGDYLNDLLGPSMSIMVKSFSIVSAFILYLTII